MTGPKLPWKSMGRSIGYIRGGVYYVRRTLHGRKFNFSTGCVTQSAALAEYRRFESSPTAYVSPLGRRVVDQAVVPSLAADATRRAVNRKYRLAPEDHDAIFHAQRGCCAVCGRRAEETDGGRLNVDHDHDTGAVRGLLCGHCNRGLGHFSDSESLLLAAAEYLHSRESGVPRRALHSA